MGSAVGLRSHLHLPLVRAGPGRGILFTVLLLSAFAGSDGFFLVGASVRSFDVPVFGVTCVFGLAGEGGEFLAFPLYFGVPLVVFSLRIFICCTVFMVGGRFLFWFSSLVGVFRRGLTWGLWLRLAALAAAFGLAHAVAVRFWFPSEVDPAPLTEPQDG